MLLSAVTLGTLLAPALFALPLLLLFAVLLDGLLDGVLDLLLRDAAPPDFSLPLEPRQHSPREVTLQCLGSELVQADLVLLRDFLRPRQQRRGDIRLQVFFGFHGVRPGLLQLSG